jgi:hypothetical protein
MRAKCFQARFSGAPAGYNECSFRALLCACLKRASNLKLVSSVSKFTGDSKWQLF